MLTSQMQDALNVALNEATMLGLEFDPQSQRVGLTLSVLALPDGPEPMREQRVLFVFGKVTRLVVSYRDGAWNDPQASILPARTDTLLAIGRELGAQPIYGWDFFGGGERELAEWGNRASLDWRAPSGESSPCSFAAFQEGRSRHLDFAFWFESLECRTPSGAPVALDELAAAGKRFWDGVHAGDQRTRESGIVAGKPPTTVARPSRRADRIASILLAGLGWACVLLLANAMFTVLFREPAGPHGHVYLILGLPIFVVAAVLSFWLSAKVRRWSAE